MSSAPAHDHASDHDAHAFDGEPAQALPDDEPRTPGWLPAVGVALFATAAIASLVSRDAAGALPKPPEAPTQVEHVAAPTARPEVRPTSPAPARSGAAGRPAMTPEQMEALKKRIEAAKARGQLPGADGSAAPARRPRPPRQPDQGAH